MRSALIFAAAFLVLSINLWRVGIASGWIDPVMHFGAQDEATYTREAIEMTTKGDWLNPAIFGRFVFEKPPLLIWLSAGAMRFFGIHPFTARIPAVFSGAVVAALCFGIVGARRSTLAGLVAALLCVSSPLLFLMSRLNMTDMPLTACILLSLAALMRDPPLARRGTQVAFIAAIAGAILLKSIAGLLPVAAALIAACWPGRITAARIRRTGLVTVCAIAIASPWFIYQLLVHREWFLADQGFQLGTVGLNPQQTSPEAHLAFYTLRLLYAAPLTLVFDLTAVKRLYLALSEHDSTAVLLICYAGTISAALLIFQFHSEQYLTPLLPVLILIAALFSPAFESRMAAAAIPAIAALWAVKVTHPDEPWGISLKPGTTVALARPLREYCREGRGNDLYVLGLNDELYALALPLRRVHYGWIDPQGAVAEARPHLLYLGVVQPVSRALDERVYTARLRAWGLHSTEPLGTGLIAQSASELAKLVPEHPESDFLVSKAVAAYLDSSALQQVHRAGADYLLLESKMALAAPRRRWTCGM